jgi:hypothetical protein
VEPVGRGSAGRLWIIHCVCKAVREEVGIQSAAMDSQSVVVVNAIEDSSSRVCFGCQRHCGFLVACLLWLSTPLGIPRRVLDFAGGAFASTSATVLPPQQCYLRNSATSATVLRRHCLLSTYSCGNQSPNRAQPAIPHLCTTRNPPIVHNPQSPNCARFAIPQLCTTRRYCNAHRSRFGWDTRGASNLDELHERQVRSSAMHAKTRPRGANGMQCPARRVLGLVTCHSP